MSRDSSTPQAPTGFTLRRTLRGHTERITRFAWSPDGRKLATPSFDKTIRIWDLETGSVLHKLQGHAHFVTGVAWSPDGLRIASSSDDSTIRIWDTQTGKPCVEPLQQPQIITGVSWSPQQSKLASSSDDRVIRIWDPQTGELFQELRGHTNRALCVGWSPKGDLLASASWDGTVRLWNAETGELDQAPYAHNDQKVFHIAWARDGRLASACIDGTVSVWNTNTGQRLAILDEHKSSVFGISFSYDGKFLVSKSDDDTLRVWRCDTWESVEVETSAKWPYACAVFHPHLPLLATAVENERSIDLWDLDFDVIFRNRAPHTLPPFDPAKNINILHLSDIHIGASNPVQHNIQLTSDLMIRLGIRRLHYLVVSGDFTDKAGDREYEKASQLLRAIANRFSLAGDRIILAPGNHDVNWDRADEAYSFVFRRHLHGDPSAGDSRYINVGDAGVLKRDEELYKKRFDNFRAFYKQVSGETYPSDYAEQATLHTFEEDRLLFLTLNSSWEIDSHFRTRASINMEALSKGLDQILDKYNGWLKIAVWHHPVSGPESMVKGFLDQLTIHNFQLIMHGHIHQAVENYHKYDSRHGIQIVSAGTFGAPAPEMVPGIPLSYNLLVLSPENRMAKVYTRKKDQPDGAWDAYAIWGDKNKPDPYYLFPVKNWTTTKTTYHVEDSADDASY